MLEPSNAPCVAENLSYLVAVALQQGRCVRVGARGNLVRAGVQRGAQAPRQVKHDLQLGQQPLHLAQLLDLVAPQLQLGVDGLAPLRHALCSSATASEVLSVSLSVLP